MKKAIKTNGEEIIKTNKSLEDFTNATLQSFENIESQLDGNIATHFYSGVPFLDTIPTSEWLTDEEKENHLGDLYYDKDTGKVYEFCYQDDTYCWSENKSNAIIEAMALANSAKDTADGKRRVFVTEPIPPYDNGDLWLNNEEIYVCQISKGPEEAFEENDFIVATMYTGDSYAIAVENELKILSGTVATIKKDVDAYTIEFEKSIKTVDEQNRETTETVKKTAYEFNTEDLKVSKEGEEVESHLSYKGLRVQKNKKDVLIADNEGVKAKDLQATTYLIVGKNSRFENYGDNRTGCFWIGS